MSLLCFAVPAFAQGADAAARYQLGSHYGRLCHGDRFWPWRLWARRIATASAAEALARNPAARPGIQLALILGLALIESLALFTLAIIFVKVK